MTRFLTAPGAVRREVRFWPSRARSRGAAAASRLRAAHLSFEDSVLSLRKAALDHVDCQDLASTALRANLDWLARRMSASG